MSSALEPMKLFNYEVMYTALFATVLYRDNMTFSHYIALRWKLQHKYYLRRLLWRLQYTDRENSRAQQVRFVYSKYGK